MPSGRFDASVAGFVVGHFAGIIERDSPEKPVAIPGRSQRGRARGPWALVRVFIFPAC